MFSVETEKYGEVRVSFRHGGLYHLDRPGWTEAEKVRMGTGCFIKAENELIAFGNSFLNPVDKHYSKNAGRKAALTRALKNAGLDRDERIKFWRQYFAAQGREDLIDD